MYIYTYIYIIDTKICVHKVIMDIYDFKIYLFIYFIYIVLLIVILILKLLNIQI